MSVRFQGEATVSVKRAGLWLASTMAIAVVLSLPAPASAQVMVDQGAGPSAEVNQSVLESLGQPRSLSDFYLGRGPAPAPSYAAPVYSRPSSAARPVLRRPKASYSADDYVEEKPAKTGRGTVTVTDVKRDKPVVKTAKAKPAPAETPDATPAPTVAATETSPAKLPVIVPKVEKAPEPAPTPAPVAVAPTPAPAPEPKPAPAPAPVVATAPTPIVPAPAPEPAPKPAPAPVVAAPAPTPIVPPAPVAPAPVVAAPAPAPVAVAPSVPAAPPLAAAPAPQQQATAPIPSAAPSAGLGDGGVTLPFDKDAAHLNQPSQARLFALANRMMADDSLQISLLAYADGDEESSGKARRLSLSRALAVRSYLIDQGVRSTRIEVRALGNKVPDGNPDRVDILVQKR